ncbi:MAG: hypothetical protein R3F20_06755 [Planctomycetota bacterium]
MAAPDAALVRTWALALEGAVERDHHGFPSFRVKKGIFATLPHPGHLHLLLPPPLAQMIADSDPEAFSELHWGKRLVGVRVELARASSRVLRSHLRTAWAHRSGVED